MLTPRTSILIVEDLPSMRKIILHLLKQVGLERADTAQEGEEAIAMLRKKAYDVVLSDWKMPGMDGLALLQAMREDPALQGKSVYYDNRRGKRGTG